MALAVGGGGAIVAAAVLGYLIKRYRDSAKNSTPVYDAITNAVKDPVYDIEDAVKESSLAGPDTLESPSEAPTSPNSEQRTSSTVPLENIKFFYCLIKYLASGRDYERGERSRKTIIEEKRLDNPQVNTLTLVMKSRKRDSILK